jgi:hypothetical protein
MATPCIRSSSGSSFHLRAVRALRALFLPARCRLRTLPSDTHPHKRKVVWLSSCVCWRGCDAERTARSLTLLSDHFLNGGGDAFPHTPYARRFHPLLPIVTEIYLCHASSCHEILRMETPGQDVRARARAPNSAEGSPRRHGGLCCCFHVGLGGPQGVRTHLARAHQSCPS